MILKSNYLHNNFYHFEDCVAINCSCGKQVLYDYDCKEYIACSNCQMQYKYNCYVEKAKVDDPQA